MSTIDLTLLSNGQTINLQLPPLPQEPGLVVQSGFPGPQGIPGPPGPVSSGETVVFEFNAPATEFAVDHFMDTFPSVTVVDSTGEEVDVIVKYIDSNHILIQVSSAMICDVYLN